MDNPVMPNGNPSETESSQDLFSVAPPPETDGEEIPGAVQPPPPQTPDPDDAGEVPGAAPVLTNKSPDDGAGRKPPLVFSEGHPLPSRNGGRDASPVREKRCVSPARRGTVHLSPGDFPPEAGFGELLAQARRKTGLSAEQVRQITKLSPGYLSALERSDLKNLPPPVYITAYIRTLCDVYGLDEESSALIRERLHAAPKAGDVPSSLIQSLEKDSAINEKEDRRIRKIFWFSVAFLVFLTLLLIGIIIAVLRPQTDDVEKPVPESAAMEEPSGKPKFTREDFDALTTPQVPEASTLSMNGKRAVVP